MEQWKKVDGFSNYEVSTTGKVRSLNYNQTGIIKELSLNPDKSTGYVRVNLSKNGKLRRVHVHRLVAEAFIPNPENKPTVNHISGNKAENHLENLEWATPREQMFHAIDTGLKKDFTSYGGRPKKSIEVYCYRTNRLLSTEESQKSAANKYNLEPPNISAVLAGRHKSHKGYYFKRVC